MSESIDPFVRKEELQKKANQLRRERDRMHDEARNYASKRDDLNAEVREFNAEASKHRTLRDELNETVKRKKDEREEANAIADVAQKAADDLKLERMPSEVGAINIPKLKREAKALEYQQMTSVLSKAKETELLDRLQEIGRIIRSRESALRKDPELRAALEKADLLREKAEKIHASIGDLAQRAQGEHEAMLQVYKKTDAIRRDADKYQEKYVVSRMDADKLHKAYIEIITEIREIEDANGGGGDKVSAEMEAAAEAVFQRFRSGDKLSTDDLLLLQRAGLL